MGNKFTIKIDDNITEQALVESCMNQIGSGYDPTLVLALYAMGKRWHCGKLIYYLNLMKKEIIALTERGGK